MRVINCSNLENPRLEEYKVGTKYAVLSHTWEEDAEVRHHDWINSTIDRSSTGWTKISGFLQKAHQDGYDYAWVDSCCINQSSEAELSVSITIKFPNASSAKQCQLLPL